jgi:mRNA interferase MazF
MRRGELWMASLDPIRGSEQAGTRPVLILQADPLNAFLRTAVIVPFTSNLSWARFPFCVQVPSGEAGLTVDSVALCHQTRAIDNTRLIRRMGEVSATTLTQVEQALRVTVDLT